MAPRLLDVRLQGTSVLHSPDSGLRRGLQLRTWFSHGPLEATPWKGASTTTPLYYATTFAVFYFPFADPARIFRGHMLKPFYINANTSTFRSMLIYHIRGLHSKRPPDTSVEAHRCIFRYSDGAEKLFEPQETALRSVGPSVFKISLAGFADDKHSVLQSGSPETVHTINESRKKCDESRFASASFTFFRPEPGPDEHCAYGACFCGLTVSDCSLRVGMPAPTTPALKPTEAHSSKRRPKLHLAGSRQKL